MTAATPRRTAPPDFAALAAGRRPARAGAGYAARGRPTVGDPVAWLADEPRAARAEDESEDAAVARREDDDR